MPASAQVRDCRGARSPEVAEASTSVRTGLWVVTVVIAVPSALWFWEVPPVGDEGTVPGRMSRDPGTSGHICGSRRIACNQTPAQGVSPPIGHPGRTTSKEQRHEQQPHPDRRPAGRDRPDGRSDPGLRHAGDDFGPATTERERGIVLDCHGEADGLQAYASIYENQRYGNHLQVVLGDPDDGNGRSKEPKRPFLVDGKVRATITVDGAKAKIRGTAAKVGKKKAVHEVHDDAGYLITVDGTHRRLANDLVLRYDGVACR